MSLRGRLFAVSVALIALAIVAADLLLVGELQANLSAHIAAETQVRLHLVSRQIAELGLETADTAQWDQVADSLGQAAAVRVTLIDATGRVLGDSEVATAGVPRLENHANRPEVLQARQKGEASVIRQSPTLGEPMLYLAQWVVPRHGPPLVVRVARKMDQVQQEISHLRRLVLVASAVGLLVAALMATLAAHWMASDVRKLTVLAQRMAAGDLAQRSNVTQGGEVATMGRAMDRMAADFALALGGLQHERDRMARVLAGLGQGVLLLDGHDKIAFANTALVTLLALPTTGTGEPLLHVLRHARLKELIDCARRQREPVEAELHWPGSTPLRIQVRAGCLDDAGNEMLAVFVDVTELRHLEALRREFVANASHELRTPIAALRGGAETAQRLLPERAAEAVPFVALVARNAERLQVLVDDLLDLSQLEGGQQHVDLVPLALSAHLHAWAEAHAMLAQKASVALVEEVAADLPAVAGNAAAIEQILANYLDNALKYGAGGGSVRIRAEARDGGVRIALRDGGPGIAPQHLPRLFERFYRVDAGRSRASGGTGLGLSIAKHLAEAMGGKVGAESAVGLGSEFWLWLPGVGVDSAGRVGAIG